MAASRPSASLTVISGCEPRWVLCSVYEILARTWDHNICPKLVSNLWKLEFLEARSSTELVLLVYISCIHRLSPHTKLYLNVYSNE